MLIESTPQLKRTFIGENGAHRTSSLFYDRWRIMQPEQQAKFLPIFSLHDQGLIVQTEGRAKVDNEQRELICAKDTYISLGDPTGYQWAIKYLHGWQHWLRLISLSWFKDAVELWNSELEAKMQMTAVKKIEDISRSGSPTAFAAAKYIAGQEWRKAASKRGRPSKAEVEGNLTLATRQAQELEDDLKRMAPHLVHSS